MLQQVPASHTSSSGLGVSQGASVTQTIDSGSHDIFPVAAVVLGHPIPGGGDRLPRRGPCPGGPPLLPPWEESRDPLMAGVVVMPGDPRLAGPQQPGNPMERMPSGWVPIITHRAHSLDARQKPAQLPLVFWVWSLRI